MLPGAPRTRAFVAHRGRGTRVSDRIVVEAVLRDPDALPRLLAETDLEP